MGEKYIGWNRKVVTMDAYCRVLKHLNYEFTNCTNKQKKSHWFLRRDAWEPAVVLKTDLPG